MDSGFYLDETGRDLLLIIVLKHGRQKVTRS